MSENKNPVELAQNLLNDVYDEAMKEAIGESAPMPVDGPEEAQESLCLDFSDVFRKKRKKPLRKFGQKPKKKVLEENKAEVNQAEEKKVDGEFYEAKADLSGGVYKKVWSDTHTLKDDGTVTVVDPTKKPEEPSVTDEIK